MKILWSYITYLLHVRAAEVIVNLFEMQPAYCDIIVHTRILVSRTPVYLTFNIL